jgi:hypothetical protein
MPKGGKTARQIDEKIGMFWRLEIRISLSLTTMLSEIRISSDWLSQNWFGIYSSAL